MKKHWKFILCGWFIVGMNIGMGIINAFAADYFMAGFCLFFAALTVVSINNLKKAIRRADEAAKVYREYCKMRGINPEG